MLRLGVSWCYRCVGQDYRLSDMFDDAYYSRKMARKEHYENHVKGWKLRACGACNGSGYYDHNGSPKCEGCEPPGSGVERYKDHILGP